MLKLSVIVLSFLSFLDLGSTNPNDPTAFFERLTDGGGIWTSKNQNYDSANPKDFSHFTMEFKQDGLGGISGTIFGINGEHQKVVLWKVLEFKNPHTGEMIFIQRNTWAYTIASSNFEDHNVRTSTFDVTYYNGAKEKHRDVHTFVDDHTIRTDSEIYDGESEKWIKQASQLWTRKQ